jgi:hypothetical protein
MPSGNDTAGDLRREAYLRRRELRQQAVDYKGGECEICKYTGFPSAFDFHHLNATTKDFNISDRLASLEIMIPELDKCALLCCRCHREVHEGLHPHYLVEDTYIDFGSPPPNDLSYEEEVDVEAALEQARVSLEVEPTVRARRNRSSSRLTVRQ